MSCNKIWINDFDIQSPVIPIGRDITDTLFNPKENWVSKRQFDFAALIGPYRKDVRRMNRTSTLGYLSATSIMEKAGLQKNPLTHTDLAQFFLQPMQAMRVFWLF